MFTSGPFPDRNTLWRSDDLSMCFVAMLSPTRVLPAPGTPVKKQIDLLTRINEGFDHKYNEIIKKKLRQLNKDLQSIRFNNRLPFLRFLNPRKIYKMAGRLFKLN